MSAIKVINNMSNFLKLHAGNKKSFLDQCADDGLKYIKEETPVDTGLLKESNESSVEEDKVIFENNQDYASYVELGTFKMAQNPFIRRGMSRLQADIPNLLKKEMEV
jgi:HK97 gp10 family phage protein